MESKKQEQLPGMWTLTTWGQQKYDSWIGYKSNTKATYKQNLPPPKSCPLIWCKPFSLLILRENKWIDQILFFLKSSKNLFSDNPRENRY